MSVSNPYYKGVKVARVATRGVKEIVSKGYYDKDKQTKQRWLLELIKAICDHYDITYPTLNIISNSRNYYQVRSETINLNKPSMVSMLHELRHHIQHKANKQYKDHNEEEDARAWSLRVFKLACPGSFKRSVKAGNIQHIKWVDGEVVNSRGY